MKTVCNLIQGLLAFVGKPVDISSLHIPVIFGSCSSPEFSTACIDGVEAVVMDETGDERLVVGRLVRVVETVPLANLLIRSISGDLYRDGMALDYDDIRAVRDWNDRAERFFGILKEEYDD